MNSQNLPGPVGQSLPFRPRRIVVLAFNKSISEEWKLAISTMTSYKALLDSTSLERELSRISTHNSPSIEDLALQRFHKSLSFPLTPEQQAAVDFVLSPDGLAKKGFVLNAVAGSGKTQVLKLQIWTLIQSGLQITVEASTFHSLGYRAWRNKVGRSVSAFGGKLSKIAKDLGFSSENISEDPKSFTSLGSVCTKLCSHAKNFGLTVDSGGNPLMPDTPESWQYLADHFDLPCDEKIISACREMLRESLVRATKGYRTKLRGKMVKLWEVDFDDMIYLPSMYGAPFDEYDWILADEVQDETSVQHRLLEKMLSQNPSARLGAAGDPFQAIYAFRGADSESIPKLIAKFGLETLPLTVSFRCAAAVVQFANAEVPYMQPRPGAPTGEIRHCSDLTVDTLPGAVLCPFNAPNARLALSCIAAGRPAYIAGRELGENLIKRLNKICGGENLTIQNFLPLLADDTLDYCTKRPDSCRNYSDENAVLQAVSESILVEQRPQAPRVDAIATKLDALYPRDIKARDPRAVHFSSIHKAKGLEWPEVLLLDFDLTGKYDKQPWQFDQSRNLRYVAKTRALEVLLLASSEDIGGQLLSSQPSLPNLSEEALIESQQRLDPKVPGPEVCLGR